MVPVPPVAVMAVMAVMMVVVPVMAVVMHVTMTAVMAAAVHHHPTAAMMAAAAAATAAAVTAGLGIRDGERRQADNNRCGKGEDCSALEHFRGSFCSGRG